MAEINKPTGETEKQDAEMLTVEKKFKYGSPKVDDQSRGGLDVEEEEGEEDANVQLSCRS